METSSSGWSARAAGGRSAVIDLSGIERMDTGGAWLIDRARKLLEAAGVTSRLEHARSDQAILLREAGWRLRRVEEAPATTIMDMLVELGASVVNAGRDLVAGVGFSRQSVLAMGRAFSRPLTFRYTSLVYHMESFGLRSVPIILLINFLVGASSHSRDCSSSDISAQAFAVDLIGILILRELGVLLTSIMIAGRSGSAITAEIGSMKMREEIDALKVMGLAPMDVLIVPRLTALILALPCSPSSPTWRRSSAT